MHGRYAFKRSGFSFLFFILGMEDHIFINDHILSYRGKPLGIILPSTFFGNSENGSTFVWGPKGTCHFDGNSEEDLLEALEMSGALLNGSSEAQIQTQRLLSSAQHSRNASFYCCNAETCEDVNSTMETISRVRVMIVGCGGIGSNTAMILAGAGIRKFTIADGDSIEESNLNRQLFWTRKDIGKFKTRALIEKLHERFDGCDIQAINQKIDKDWIKANARNSECIVIAADEPETLVGSGPEIALECGVHVFGAGYMHHMAHVIHSPPDMKSDQPTPNPSPRIQWRRSPNSIMPSYGPTNMLLASLLSSRLIQALIGKASIDRPRIQSWNPIESSLESHVPEAFPKLHNDDLRAMAVGTSIKLKAISQSDGPALHQMIVREKERLSKSLHWPRFINSFEDTARFCANSEKSFGNSNAIYIAEFNGELAGVISFNHLDFSNGIGDLGYWLASDHEKEGIVSNSIEALVQAYAAAREIRRFIIKCAARNRQSRAVAERLGFQFEGTLRQAEKIGDEYLDQRIYARIV
jgi:RimJ/RimL family protein N-acetyltransferase